MNTMPSRPYDEVRKLLKSIGGEMSYHPGGEAGGGVWELHLWGKTIKVEVRDHKVNSLDRLYDTKLKNPKTWEDYDAASRLADDAVWKLVDLFRS